MMGKKKKIKQAGNEIIVSAPSAVSPYWYYGLVLLVLLVVAFIRIHTLDFPLERDEGEYAYAGQLILQGIPPYQLAYNMKLPGTYAAYACILAIFGETPRGVHLGLLLINVVSVILMYFLAARLFDRLTGVIACASYALLSAGLSVLGFAGHATHFVVLPAIAGILLLLKGLESERSPLFFWSGLLLGLAFIMKQPGIFFVLFAGFSFLMSESKQPADRRGMAVRGGLLLLGAVLPFALTCLILFTAGVFPKFWFWTFSYAREYATVVKFSEGLRNFRESASFVVAPAVWIWSIAAVGLFTLLANRKARGRAVFVLGFLFFSFAAVCPGLRFREHYFILLLPATSLLAGIAVSTTAKSLSEHYRSWAVSAIPVAIFLIAFAVAVVQQQLLFLDMGPAAVYRALYGPNPFPEAVKIGDYLRTHSSEKARIAVLGSEPEIYFYAGRHSATGYIYTYALMEGQRFAPAMQREMIAEIESARPDFLVSVHVPTSWGERAASDTTIFSWADAYVQSGYEVVGIVDIFSDRTEYRWEREARSYRPGSPDTVYVYRKTR